MTSDRVDSDLRSFIDRLRREGELVEVECEVDPKLELAEVHRRIIAAGGPAILFKRPKDSDFPVVTNLFGTARRVEMAFGSRPREVIEEVARAPEELVPPSPRRLWKKRGLIQSLLRVGMKRRGRGPVNEVEESPRLSRLPCLTTWPDDGGPFVTLPLVYTEHPETGVANLGMYRMHVYDDRTTGMHWQIGKGGGFHWDVAGDRGHALPVHVFLGGPPALVLSAIAPLPENVPELLLASLVLGKKLPLSKTSDSPLPLAATAEFCLVGEVKPKVLRPEGPFGDHYGYYSLTHDYPVFDVKKICRRRDAIYPATVVGKPRQEDFFIGDFLQEMLSPLFPIVMPAVRDLWSYGETGYHSLSAAVVRERYKREAMVSAFRILGEGQLSLTKFLLVVDAPLDLKDFSAVLEHVLARADFRTDLFCFSNLSMDSLDYSGPVINEGSKGVLLGLGDARRDLPRHFQGELPHGVTKPRVFCGGCLVVEGSSKSDDAELAQRLADDAALREWPLVVLVDDADKAAKSSMNFLWTTFTRFEPAADMYTRSREVVRNHRAFEMPLVIDARLGPNFPDEVLCDPATSSRVTERWTEYFPGGMEMGDSDAAHLD